MVSQPSPQMVCQKRICPPRHFAIFLNDAIRRILLRHGSGPQQRELQAEFQTRLQLRHASGLRHLVRWHVQIFGKGDFYKWQHVLFLRPSLPAECRIVLFHDSRGSEHRGWSLEQEAEDSVE